MPIDRTLTTETATQLELFDAREVVRPDINIAKWSGLIFASPWARDLYQPKKIIVPTGDEGEASITIVPGYDQKRPTTTTQRVFLALLQIWEDQGKPTNGRIRFSARQIAHLLDWRWAGRDTASRIREQLFVLDNTSIDWLRTFYAGEYLETYNEQMNLVDAKSYLGREHMTRREMFTAQHSVRLNQDLVENMLAGRTKPVNFLAIRSVNDSALTLYNLLDNFLAKKRRWERRAYALIYDDLELSGSRYKTAFARKAKLQELQRELDGKELSSGTLKIGVAKTADGKDWKLVADKIPAAVRKGRVPPKLANPKDDIPLIVEDIMDGLSQLGTTHPNNTGVLTILARWYPRQMLFDVLSLLKADYRGQIKKSPIKAYVYLTHVEAHKRGREWISECGADCKHRPENRLPLEQLLKQNA